MTHRRSCHPPAAASPGGPGPGLAPASSVPLAVPPRLQSRRPSAEDGRARTGSRSARVCAVAAGGRVGPASHRWSVPEPPAPARPSPLRTGLCGRSGGSGRDRLGLRLGPASHDGVLGRWREVRDRHGMGGGRGKMGQRRGDAPSKPGHPRLPAAASSWGGGQERTAARSPRRGPACGTATLDFRAPARGTIRARRSGLPACGGLQRRPTRRGCQSLACKWLDRPVTYP